MTRLVHTRLVHTRAELAAARDALPGTVAVVMTMGALHEGHASLLRAARQRADSVLATVFVNPLQFAPHEDYDRYPRTLAADLEVGRAEGVDAVFAPDRAEMYPGGDPAVRVDPGPLGGVLEGASRPGFFNGVLTVVLKLLHLTRPDLAYFGEKDYQQLTLVRAMVRDVDLPVEVVGVPTVREPDGLARSSRNKYLSAGERPTALALSRSLSAGVAAAGAGGTPGEVLAAARATFAGYPGAKLDYLALTDSWLRPLVPAIGADLAPDPAPDPAPYPTPLPAAGAAAGVPASDPAWPSAARQPCRLLVAAWVGSTRLIDNVALEII